MARFSALVSDSSDDELGPYAPQDAHQPGPSSIPLEIGSESSSGSDRIEVDDDDDDDDEETEEEEEEEEMDENEMVVLPLKSTRQTRNHALAEDSDNEIQYKHPRLRSHSSTSSESDSDFEVPHHMDDSVVPLAQRVGIDAQKMHVMQTSLFRMPEEVAALQAMNKPARPRFRLSPSVARKHSRESVGEGRLDSQEVGDLCHWLCPRLINFSEGIIRS